MLALLLLRASFFQNKARGASDATNQIEAANGENAAFFADPSGNVSLYDGSYGEPQQRGDVTDKDAYMLGILSINYKPARRRRNLPKF